MKITKSWKANEEGLLVPDVEIEVRSAVVTVDPEEIVRCLTEAPDDVNTVVQKRDGFAHVTKGCFSGAAESVFGDVEDGDLSRLAEQVGIPWQTEYRERVVPYWASDERVDSHGDIVRQDWLFDLFEDNPVMPYGHRWEEMPIGAHLDWRVVNRNDSKYRGPALALLALFATKTQSEWADSVFRMVQAGFLKAGSVGFYAGRVIWIDDDDERAALGLGRWGYILEQNTLLEYSPVTLGANPGAYVLASLDSARRSGKLQVQDFATLRDLGRVRCAREDRDGWADLDARLRSFARTLFGAELDPHEDVDEPFEVEAADEFLDAAKTLVALAVDDDEEPEEDPEGDETEDDEEDEKSLDVQVDEPEGDDADRIARLEAEVQRLHGALETTLVSLQQQADETRELAERLATRLDAVEFDSTVFGLTGDEGDEDTVGGVPTEAIERFLSVAEGAKHDRS